MATRTKMTPFARFFLVLVFLVPIAFFVATYVNGEDPIAKAKELVGIETAPSETYERGTIDSTPPADMDALRTENAKLRRQVQELEAKVKQLEGDGTNREKWGN